MVIENTLLPFYEWILPALWTWGQVILTLVGLAVVIGGLVAIVRNGPKVGLKIVGRALLDGVHDIFCMSPRRIWALTWLSVKDSIRRRVLVVFVFFLVILLFAGWFLDPSSEHPLRLYLSFILTATSYMVLLLVLFLSTFSIPGELKNKTLHTVVTKPVKASEIVLGRMLGFTLVGTILLCVMGSISYVFVVRGLVHTHQIVPDRLESVVADTNVSDRNVPLKGESSTNSKHKHDVLINAKGVGSLQMTQDHWHSVVRREGAGKDGKDATYEVSGPKGLFIARVPIYGTLRFLDRDQNETDKGINVGDEWAYRGFIAGGSPAAAIWTFKGVTPAQFPKVLPVEMTLAVFRTYKGDIVSPIPGSLWVRNPKTGLSVLASSFGAKEFKTNVERIPRKITAENACYYRAEKTGGGNLKYVRKNADDSTLTKDELATLRKGTYDLFDDLSDEGSFEIWLRCLQPAQYYGAAQADLYLHARNASFALNFIKGYFGIWMQMLLVLGFGVMFSTFLSGPIATLATVGILIGGLFHSFVVELAAGPKYGGGPIESLIRMLAQMNMIVDMEPGMQTSVVKSIDYFLQGCLGRVVYILPDFSGFSAANYVSYGFDVPGDWIGQYGLTALGFAVALFVAGYFFLKTREVAR